MIHTWAASQGLPPDSPAFWMPLVFMLLLCLLVGAGVVFDGFDIGVGILLCVAAPALRPKLMSQLSPWRDANEFWPFLAFGLFCAAFPFAYGTVLSDTYGGLCVMLSGGVLRSVAFEFRLRAPAAHKARWIMAFFAGSALTAFGQGVMLAQVITNYDPTQQSPWLAVFLGLCMVALYALLGAGWLLIRLDDTYRPAVARWAHHSVRWVAAGVSALAVILALDQPEIFYKWGSGQHFGPTIALWCLILLCFVLVEMLLNRATRRRIAWIWLPFALTMLLCLLTVGGLAYSMFPYFIFDDTTVWDAAASVPSLQLLLAGSVVVIPVIIVFNVLAYRSLFRVPGWPSPPGPSGAGPAVPGPVLRSEASAQEAASAAPVSDRAASSASTITPTSDTESTSEAASGLDKVLTSETAHASDSTQSADTVPALETMQAPDMPRSDAVSPVDVHASASEAPSELGQAFKRVAGHASETNPGAKP